MRLCILFVALWGIFLSCSDDDYPYAEIPSVVRNGFWIQFPVAAEVEFYKYGEHYGVEFETEGRESEVIITADGKVLKEKKEIAQDHLPHAVRQALYSNFGREKVETPQMVRVKNEIYYQVEIDNFFGDKQVVLNEAGEQDPTLTFWN